MVTSRPQPPRGVEAPDLLPLKEITELLIKQRGYHEGLFDLVVEFQMSVGSVGPNPSVATPGVIAGVTRIGLIKTEISVGVAVVDAAIVNPLPQPTQ